MAKAPTTETIAAELTVPERVLLFCLASDTNLVKAEVSHSTAQHLLVRNPVERNHATDFTPTDQGRSVLDALIRKARPGTIVETARPTSPSASIPINEGGRDHIEMIFSAC
jgi:hypothetical protein